MTILISSLSSSSICLIKTHIFEPKQVSNSKLQSPISKALCQRPKMKAIVISSPGGPEVLQLQQVEDPELKDDEVLIKVQASALNRADTVQRIGAYPPPKGASNYLGLECSGTIEAVGKSVSRWKIGDQVAFFYMGFSLFDC
jgi:D-arabinose 1-dehydrogenase-like Zn-dependent alcohol dehydrogenase